MTLDVQLHAAVTTFAAQSRTKAAAAAVPAVAPEGAVSVPLLARFGAISGTVGVFTPPACLRPVSLLVQVRGGTRDGAPARNRTADLLPTMETLCRLSYRGRTPRHRPTICPHVHHPRLPNPDAPPSVQGAAHGTRNSDMRRPPVEEIREHRGRSTAGARVPSGCLRPSTCRGAAAAPLTGRRRACRGDSSRQP